MHYLNNNLNIAMASAHKLFYAGQRKAALVQLVDLRGRHPDVVPLKQLLRHLIAKSDIDVPTSVRFSEELIMCFDENQGNAQRLFVVADTVFRSDGSFIGALAMVGSGSLEANRNALIKGWLHPITQNRLLKSVLHKAFLAKREYERALTQIRKTITHSFVEDSGNFKLGKTIEHDFCSSLAIQCWLNEYVYAIGEDEQQLHHRLREYVERSMGEMSETTPWTSRLEAALLIVAMYQPLHELRVPPHTWKKPGTVWPASLRPLVAEATRYFEEQDIKNDIPSIATIENRVSIAVSSQYEENPYPRWSSLPDMKRVSVGSWLSSTQPHFTPPGFLHNPVRLLMAGCGTGRELVWRHGTWHTSKIVAVDLSLSSLAYAIRKSREINIIGDIEFLHGDILQLHQLPKQEKSFDVITCIGVLHHMEDPMLGWQILVDLLRPNGIIIVGLYSQLARRVITRARHRIEDLGTRPTRDEIRAFRQCLFSGKYPDLMSLTTNPDMYSTSMCRDLLFHVQELQFCIQDIKLMLNRLGLGFVGFGGIEEAKRQYAQMFPEDHALNNLDNWSAFEEQHPHTFESMYLIIAQKC